MTEPLDLTAMDWKCPVCEREFPDTMPDGVHCVDCNNPDMVRLAYFHDTIEGLRAENARLRGALTEVADAGFAMRQENDELRRQLDERR